MKKIRLLFQGDSITDAERNRDDYYDLGKGYPFYAAKMLREKYPQVEWEFINRGVGGDRTPDMAARWQKDCIDLKPDILSTLIGINDAAFDVSDEEHERLYTEILNEAREKTGCKILMVEAFLLVTPGRESLRAPLDAKLTVQRRVARACCDEFCAVDGPLTGAALHHELTSWAWDGVHPSPEAAEFIAGEYVRAISKIVDKML